MSLPDMLMKQLNRLTKWRSVFAGWQLGTRTKDDPESQAVRDHREITILMRAELSAVTRLMLDKGICTHEEFQRQLLQEVNYLDESYAIRFPGFKSTDDGMIMTMPDAAETTKGWRP